MATSTSHGLTHERAAVALLLIDFINDFEFDGGEDLLPHARAAAREVATLKARCDVPVVYVNDNFGRWRSDFRATVEHCLDSRGRPLVELLRPTPEDYFVLKPKNSGFFGTSLQPLLDHLGARTLVLTGLTGENCVLFTAHDAYLRSYRLVIPSDGVASEEPARNEAALEQMRRALKAATPRCAEVDVSTLAGD